MSPAQALDLGCLHLASFAVGGLRKDLRMPKLSLSTALGAAVLLLLIGASPRLVATSPDGIPFDDSRGTIVLRGSVNGQTARIMLDSGADGGMVSQAFAERAGISVNRSRSINIIGVFGEATVFPSLPFDLELGGQEVRLRDFPVTPGIGFDIILGRGMFQQGVVQIDYPNRLIRFFPRDALNFEGNVNTRIGQGGNLLVEMTIEGGRAWLALDTGNSGPTVLTRSFVRRHRLQNFEATGIQLGGAGVIATGQMTLLAMGNAELGPFPFEGFLALYNPDGRRGLDGRRAQTGGRVRQATAQFDGLLGYEVLRNFVVTTDFRNKQLHLYLP